MPLTRNFRVTIHERLQKDASFRKAVLSDALETMVRGDLAVGKAVLRSYIHGTVGFIRLAEAIGKSPKSLMRMFSPSGNPQAKNLFDVLAYLQEADGIQLNIKASRADAKSQLKRAA